MNLNEELRQATKAKVEDVNRVLELIGQGADINVTYSNGLTPSHYAAQSGHYNICKTLLENGAGINSFNVHGLSPLIFATTNNHENVVRLLLEKADDIKLKIVDIRTALHLATNPNIVALLIEHGADINHVFKQQTPLHRACVVGRKDVVEMLLHNGANIEAKDGNGKKPVDIAKDKGFNQIVEMFEKNYPLWVRFYDAARQGYFEQCKALLEQDALVDSTQRGLYCPVTAASNNGHYRIVELLLCKRPWTNNKDNNKRNPMYLATKKGHKDIVSLLMDNGASPLIKVNGDTLVHVAVINHHGALARFLIQKGLNPNLKNNVGYTPLHYAAINGSNAIVTCLIEEKLF